MCPICKKGTMKTRDHQFMIRETCNFCGFNQDAPKPGHEQEFQQWLDAKSEALVDKLEDY